MEKSFSELSGPGYGHPHRDIFIPKKDLFEYAMEQIESDEEKREEFIEWFYRMWDWYDGM